MKDLYELCGITKQSLHKYLSKQSDLDVLIESVVQKAVKIREAHPQLGCRSMHQLLSDSRLGRDKCEQILLEHGFRIKRVRSYIKTTVSQKHLKFPNLIEGLEVQRINQVWQSDLTYFITPNCGVFYLVFILDVYSRRILGFTANNHMRAEANIACLSMAIKARTGTLISGVIHHSDYGSQYGSDDYLNALQLINAQVSMTKSAWKNAYAERINGTMKNDYLMHRKIASLADLRYHLRRDIKAYNQERPHKALPKKMSPVQFEKYLQTAPIDQHPKFKIYDEKQKTNRSGLSPTQSIMETLFQFP